ncbi:glycosyltransferase family 25 protein [Pantoea sp.]|uniref:glycosyltransferase family 25 protein n=1 Tax=Pantoea sp. TaxID=69393 RepID=UPI0031DC8CC8
MKVFIINLENYAARKEHALQQCNSIGLEADVFNAIDGRLLSPQQISEKTHPELSVGLTESEIGCALSHHGVYEKMVRENIELALVLEDDVLFDDHSRNVIDYLSNHFPQRPTLCLLSEVRKYLRGGEKIPTSDHKIVNVSQAALAHAYFINLAAAKKLYEFMYPIWLEADRWTFLIESDVVNIKAVVPPIGHLSELSFESTIWHGGAELESKKVVRELRKVTVKKIRNNRPLKIKLKNSLWRIFIRPFFEVKQD